MSAARTENNKKENGGEPTRPTLRVEPTLWASFKQACGREDRTMSAVLRRMIREYVAAGTSRNRDARARPGGNDADRD